jgi:hypothetical protein
MPNSTMTRDIELFTRPGGGREQRIIERPLYINGRRVPGNAEAYNRTPGTAPGLVAARRAGEVGGRRGRGAAAGARAAGRAVRR